MIEAFLKDNSSYYILFSKLSSDNILSHNRLTVHDISDISTHSVIGSAFGPEVLDGFTSVGKFVGLEEFKEYYKKNHPENCI